MESGDYKQCEIAKYDRDSDVLPVYLDAKLNAVAFEDAVYYYATTFADRFGEGQVTLNYHGSAVHAVLIQTKERTQTAAYFAVDQDLMPAYASVLVPVNAAFSQKYAYDLSLPASLESIAAVTGSAVGKKKQSLMMMIKNAESQKISAHHHEHFRANEMWAVISKIGRHRARQFERLGFRPHQAMMAGLLLWAEVMPERLWQMVAGTDLFDSENLKSFSKTAKAVSVKSKQLQNLCEEDLRPMFEIEVLVNRITQDVDWGVERQNRTATVLADMDENEVYEAAANIFSIRDSTVRKPREVKWDDFWHNRWQWSAAGSVYTTHSVDAKYVSSVREYKNKFVTLALMPNTPLKTFLQREPRLDARASVKYEWGKVRAIYGCDLTSYILSTYAFNGCEDSLPSAFPVGRKATARYVSSRVAGLLDSQLPFTLDFEDFNSQHSIPAMKAVLNAWLDINANSLSQEQLDAGKWTVESLDQSWVHNRLPGHDETYKAEGTLFSGWRLTSFVNTVLNKVYTDKILKGSPYSGSLHNGDDVLVATRNFVVARDCVKRALKYNVRLQPTKTSFGAIAEFLRVDHMSADGGQYATRSIATLVHSRIESGPASDARAAIESYESRYNDFMARTGRIDLIVSMRRVVERRMAEIFHTDTASLRKLRRTHRVCGGLSNDRDADLDVIYTVKQKEGTILDQQETERVAEAPGIKQYAKELCRLFDLQHFERRFTKRISDATLDACAARRKRLVMEENSDIEQYITYRALYKTHSYLNSKSDFGKAKLVGIAIQAMANYSAGYLMRIHLRHAKDPIKALSVMV